MEPFKDMSYILSSEVQLHLKPRMSVSFFVEFNPKYDK